VLRHTCRHTGFLHDRCRRTENEGALRHLNKMNESGALLTNHGTHAKLQFRGTGNFVFQSERECCAIGWITIRIDNSFSRSEFLRSQLLFPSDCEWIGVAISHAYLTFVIPHSEQRHM
jgi:hypothetical protein